MLDKANLVIVQTRHVMCKFGVSVTLACLNANPKSDM